MPGLNRQSFIIIMLMLLGFVRLLSIKYVSMNSHQCMVRPTLIDLNLDEFHYYPFIISMNRCDKSFNTVEDPFVKICIPSKIDKWISESKKLKKTSRVSVDVNLMVENMTQDKKWESDKCQCDWEKPIKHRTCEEYLCSCKCEKDCKIGEYLKGCEYVKRVLLMIQQLKVMEFRIHQTAL